MQGQQQEEERGRPPLDLVANGVWKPLQQVGRLAAGHSHPNDHCGSTPALRRRLISARARLHAADLPLLCVCLSPGCGIMSICGVL